MEVRPQIGICSFLSEFGHKVTWIISSATGGARQFTLDNISVHAIPYVRYFGESNVFIKIISKVANALRRMYRIPRLFKGGHHNLIFVRDDVFDGLVAACLRKRYDVPFVFELSNPLEQEWAIYKAEAKRPKFLYHLAAWFNAFMQVRIMKKADIVLPTTEWFEDSLVKRGISRLKLMPYPNGVDVKSFIGKDGRDIIEKYHLNGCSVLLYIGTMDKARSLSLLLEAFARVSRDREEVRLLMVGDGNDKDSLERQAIGLGISDGVIFTGHVPQSAVPSFIAAADIAVSPVPPLNFYQVSSPIKLFEYMAMAKPVVANEEIFEQKEVLAQSGGGIAVPFSAEAFAGAIIELLNNREKAVEMGQRGQEWVLKNRSYEVLARRLEERFLKLLTK